MFSKVYDSGPRPQKRDLDTCTFLELNVWDTRISAHRRMIRYFNKTCEYLSGVIGSQHYQDEAESC